MRFCRRSNLQDALAKERLQVIGFVRHSLNVSHSHMSVDLAWKPRISCAKLILVRKCRSPRCSRLPARRAAWHGTSSRSCGSCQLACRRHRPVLSNRWVPYTIPLPFASSHTVVIMMVLVMTSRASCRSAGQNSRTTYVGSCSRYGTPWCRLLLPPPTAKLL